MFVSSTAEAVLQEMDNISSIRQNREVERLRMWTGDTEEVSAFFFSAVITKEKLNRCAAAAPWSYGNVSNNVKFFCLFFFFLGKHGYVLQGKAEEIHAQEQLQHAYAPQSHEQN